MALMILNGWPKCGVARKVRGWFGSPGECPGCLEWSGRLCLVQGSSGVMVLMVWIDCDKHGVARIGLSGPGAEFVVL